MLELSLRGIFTGLSFPLRLGDFGFLTVVFSLVGSGFLFSVVVVVLNMRCGPNAFRFSDWRIISSMLCGGWSFGLEDVESLGVVLVWVLSLCLFAVFFGHLNQLVEFDNLLQLKHVVLPLVNVYKQQNLLVAPVYISRIF